MSATDKWIIREKTTNAFEFILKADGDAIVLTGVDHVVLHMIDKMNKTYQYSSADSSPAVVITDAANGEVTFTPPSTSVFLYRRSPYRLYFTVWETTSSCYSCPESSSFEINVLKEY